MSKDLIENSQIVNNLVDDDWFVLVCVCNDLISIVMSLQKIFLFVYHVVSNVFSLCDNREIDVWSIDTRILVLVEDDESILVAIAYDDVCLTNSIDIEVDESRVKFWVTFHVVFNHFICDEEDQDKMFVWFCRRAARYSSCNDDVRLIEALLWMSLVRMTCETWRKKKSKTLLDLFVLSFLND